MKLDAVLRIAAGFLATDKKPEDLKAAILAADKKAKDAAGSGLGARELEEKDQPKAQDEREAAVDAREAAMDEAEEKKDVDGKDESKEAKDRKTARDSRKSARDARKVARDKRAKDRNDDPEHTNDEDYTQGSDPSTPGGSRAGGKTAIDGAEVDKRIAQAVSNRDALHAARTEVEPIIGKVAFDTAAEVYRAALDHLKVDHKHITETGALRTLVSLAKDRADAATPPALGYDSAGLSAMAKLIPGYDRLK
jgi:hypothetical protein